MRALIQRVCGASVSVDGEVIGRIAAGLVVFVGVARGDSQAQTDYIVGKTVNLRIFPDSDGRFDRSALDAGAELLAISQFTLYADTRRGRRPGFTQAAPPDEAAVTFENVLAALRETGLKVETGRFQAHMMVEIHNDGPVTIMLDSNDLDRPRRG